MMAARRLRVALLFGVAAAACDDPSIQLELEIPPAYRDQVEQVALDLILPPAGDPFDCEKIAFREVDEDAIASARLQQVTVRAGEPANLSEIPRKGDKLFRVLGLDDAGTPIVAACAEVATIEGDLVVPLTAEPTATAILPAFNPANPLPEAFQVAVLDANLEPIRGIETRFTVTGPGPDSSTMGSATTNADGLAMLAPRPPVIPGPIAVDVRPRWVQAAPPSLLAYREPPVVYEATLPGDVDPELLGNPKNTFAIGRIGPAGEMGIAALGPSANPLTVGRQVFLAYYDPSLSPPFRTATSAPIPGAFALGLLDTGSRDQLVTATGSAWIEIAPTGAVASGPAPYPGRRATAIFPAGGCDGAPSSDEVLIVWSDDTMSTHRAGGAVADSPFDDQPAGTRVLGSGCVIATDGETYRAAVYGDESFRAFAVAEMDVVRQSPLPSVTSDVGFAPAIGGTGPHLLATELTIEGTELTRYRLLALGAGGLDLEVVTRDPTPSIPTSIAGGDIDADGELDIVALLSFGDSDRGSQFRLLEILEVDHLGDRLAGLSPVSEAIRPRGFTADFDGDGVAEVVIATPLSVTVMQHATAD